MNCKVCSEPLYSHRSELCLACGGIDCLAQEFAQDFGSSSCKALCTDLVVSCARHVRAIRLFSLRREADDKAQRASEPVEETRREKEPEDPVKKHVKEEAPRASGATRGVDLQEARQEESEYSYSETREDSLDFYPEEEGGKPPPAVTPKSAPQVRPPPPPPRRSRREETREEVGSRREERKRRRSSCEDASSRHREERRTQPRRAERKSSPPITSRDTRKSPLAGASPPRGYHLPRHCLRVAREQDDAPKPKQKKQRWQRR